MGADGHAEREAALAMIERHTSGSTRRLTLGADKGYDSADFVADLRRMCVTPQVAQNDKGRRSAIDSRTTRHAGYEVSASRTRSASAGARPSASCARPCCEASPASVPSSPST
jgi:hypothetical protein